MKTKINTTNPLLKYTLLFSQKVCDTIKDMTGQNFEISNNTATEHLLHFNKEMIVYIHFYGAVQGEFIIAINEKFAASLAGISEESIIQYREDYSGLLKEVLNIASAQTLAELEYSYKNLTYFPAIVVFGDIIFPSVKSALTKLDSDTGSLNCGFSLNLVSPKIAKELNKVEKSLKTTTKLACTDALTGLYNRAFFDDSFTNLINTAFAKNEKLSMMIIDIDFFKTFNDKFGHLVGDQVIRILASTILSCIRDSDIAIRYGGDELIILLTETGLNGAIILAERIRNTVKSKKYHTDKDGEISPEITLSIGLTQLHLNDNPLSFFSRADSNLYQAKKEGRDRSIAK